ncbi:transcriptional regulator, partial [Streptomyces sp. SID2119]|nr:transcriptional regulator [Streptomyces sp. SID2119]
MTTTAVRLTEAVPQRGVRRTLATLLHPDRAARITDEHLRVRLSAPHPLPLLADVLVAEFPPAGIPPHEDPVRYAAGLADCHPGALVVAVYRGPRCWLRFGGRARTLVREP